MSRTVAPPRVLNIDDLRRAAKRRLPRVVFDYIDGGADAEVTLRENCRAFEDVLFRPRSAVATRRATCAPTVLGTRLELPFLLAPVGSSRMFYPRGEEAAARAAGKAGTGYILSTLSGCRLEDVKAATTGPAWYQLYLVGGRDVALAAIARAQGRRLLGAGRHHRHAGRRPARARSCATASKELLTRQPVARCARTCGSFLARPRWLAEFLRRRRSDELPQRRAARRADAVRRRRRRARAVDRVAGTTSAGSARLWKGPIVVKGVHTADDARRAVDEGAEAVVVSNHGGRQLDGVAADAARRCRKWSAAVGDQTEVLLDGGIRRGSDVVKALCLGARPC